MTDRYRASDLHELERKARACQRQDPMAWRADLTAGDDEASAHAYANSPPVTLALIARIRELEGTIRSFARPELHGAQVVAALHGVLDKGTVLP